MEEEETVSQERLVEDRLPRSATSLGHEWRWQTVALPVPFAKAGGASERAASAL